MNLRDFKAIRVSLASPEDIRSWSHGEVTKPETINYRRLRPEKDGLFCEAIFGPTKDYQCYCGKYKKIRYRGVVCEKCGVEVTRSRVRRERMGHIELASPVAHIWYTRRVPSYLGLLLNISRRNLDRVLYFAQYIITHVDEEVRQKALRRLDEEMGREVGRVQGEAQEQIDEIELHLEEEIAKLRATTEANRQRLEEQLEAATNEVMSAAAQVQKSLEDRRDGPVPAPVIFAPTQTVIVEQGGVITREHFSLLKQAVDAKLSEIEIGIREEQERNHLLLEAEEDRLRHEAEEKIKAITRQMEREIEEIRAGYQAQRDELKSLAPRQLLNEAEYQALTERWGGIFRASMGAEALYDIVKEIDLDKMAQELRHEIRTSKSKQRRKKATKRLGVVEALRRSGNRPEWMILTVLPVIPPDLRPMVQLDGGRFATSDLNDLYRRVINRNNRLKRLLELGAPDVIIRNEKRMLQEAVDSLIDNSRRGKAVSTRGRRKLKSLSDMLKGKQGRFRRNLLGKRVDYSGRSVIVIGPHLELHQCGLPKTMALELFRPFVMRKLVEYGHVHNVKGAKRLIERMDPVVWEVLEEIIQDYPILLNRAPTLHRLGIQAFQPVLVEGNAIQIHPLVCAAFNADFDGDQMAVHIPLSKAAKEEAKKLMLSRRNLLLPANGEPIVNPTKDMVLGCYYLTMEEEGARGEGKIFADLDEVELAYSLGKVDLHARILVHTTTYYTLAGRRYSGGRAQKRLIETTVGRALFNQVLPPKMRYVNELLDKGKLKELVAEAYNLLGQEETARLVDRIKDVGFRYATRSGLTIAIDDITIPQAKAEILDQVSQEVAEIERQYRRGLITEEEQYVKTVELWTKATDDITEAVAEAIDPQGSIRAMAVSGATKGGFQPIRQLAGMRGLMADPAGRIIPLPIRSNFREGLTALEYFISTHGARKGLADTALRTADAGYLTRRLVDVAQDAIINAHDCGTKGGIWIRERDVRGVGETLAERLFGRITAAPVVDPKTGEILVEKGEMLGEEQIERIERAGIGEVYVRSPLACQLRHGVCAMCYGRDLARGGLVQIGEAVGIIAAQSIGEPGTQLTLRTFHTGGVAGVEDITHGLPRVQELFEARSPKGEAIISDIAGVVEIHQQEGGLRRVKVVDRQIYTDKYPRPRGGYKTLVQDGDEIEGGTVLACLARGDTVKEIVATAGGRVILKEDQILVRREEREEREYAIPAGARIRVEEGQRIAAGQPLTEGPLNPHRILAILGREATQEYLLTEIQKVYRSQGVNINDKHIEMIIRQMMGKVRVRSAGDTDLLPGNLVDRLKFEEINARVMERGKKPATAQPILLGITKAALNTESFLSAASFQHTINVLAGAAIEGRVDELHGLKENVIIGKLIPAGTGYRARYGYEVEAPEGVGQEVEAQTEVANARGTTTQVIGSLEPPASVREEGEEVPTEEFEGEVFEDEELDLEGGEEYEEED
ncbi:MAG: DNA-directed RNA polymerase subunit beta' [Anaerolineae bacterium]